MVFQWSVATLHYLFTNTLNLNKQTRQIGYTYHMIYNFNRIHVSKHACFTIDEHLF